VIAMNAKLGSFVSNLSPTFLNSGYRMNNGAISMVCYADDAAIFAERENDLQRQLFKFYQISQQLNMDISTGKTKTMIIARELQAAANR